MQAFQHPLSENPGTDGDFKEFIRMGFQHEEVHVEVCRAAAYFAVDLLYPHVRLHDFGVRQRMPLECFSIFYRLFSDTNFFVDDIVHDEIRPFISMTISKLSGWGTDIGRWKEGATLLLLLSVIPRVFPINRIYHNADIRTAL